MAKQLVEGGLAECTMALGFEKMQRGSLSSNVCKTAFSRDDVWLVMELLEN